MKSASAALACLLLGSTLSHAAIDSFTSANGNTGPNTPPPLDSGFGAFELALNLGNSSGGSLVYDGITFTNNNVTSGTNTITWATVNGISVSGTGAPGAVWQNATNIVPGSAGPSGIYNSLFGTESWSNGSGINQTVGITGLDAGKSYQIQLLHGEDRSLGNGFSYWEDITATDSASNSLNVNFRFGDEGDAGDFVFGVVTVVVSGVTGVDISYPATDGVSNNVSDRDPSLAAIVIHSTGSSVPAFTSLDPATGATAVALTGNLQVTFNDTMQKGSGSITIVSEDGNAANDEVIDVTSGQVTVSGDTVTIDPAADLTANTDYRVVIEAGALQSTGGTGFLGISGSTWSFTTTLPPALVGELGILDVTNANGGINPSTGQPWAAGDTYRLAFVTSGTRNASSPAIADYDTFVQSAANAVGWGAAIWKCVGQSANNPDAKANTGTSGPGGVGIFLVDGITRIADDYSDLWDGNIDSKWNRTETGGTYEGAVATGSSRKFGDSTQPNIEHGSSGQTGGQWWQIYNGAQSAQWHFYALSEELTVIDSRDLAEPSLIVADPAVLQPVLSDAGPVTRSIPITNGGSSETLVLTGVGFGGTAGSQFSSPVFPSSLAPGESGTIGFTFTPGTPGLATATMTIDSNAEGSPATTIALRVETLTNLVPGITYQAYQTNRPLTAMPTLISDQTPNIDELRTAVDYKDDDKDGAADGGAAYGFGTMPPLDQLEDIYCEVTGVVSIANSGDYEFRLTADDGARLEIDGSLEIDNSAGVRSSPVAAESGVVPLVAGFHDIRIAFWSGAGSPCLKLEWKRPGSAIWETIGAHDAAGGIDGFLSDDYTRVVSTGDKAVYFPEQGQSSGELGGLHPGYDLFTIAGDFGAAGGDPSMNPPDILIDGTATPYRPQTGAIGLLADGTLIQAGFTPFNYAKDVPPPDDATANDKLYAVSGADGNDISAVTVREIASGLNSPMGVVEVDGDLYVAEVFKITRLRDINGDGDYLDPEDTEETIALIVADNFHNWTFGLIHQDGWLHVALSADIGGTDSLGSNGYAPATRGNWIRVCIDPAQAPVGTTEQLAGGLRTPNGLGIGPAGTMFGTDNQGSWNPDNSLYELTPGHFYGHYNLWFQFGAINPLTNPQGVAATGLADPTRQPSAFWDMPLYWGAGETPIYADPFHGGTRRFTRPAVHLQQNSMCNSPTDPLLIGDQHPAFKGQMFIGEHTRGGIRRVFLEKINGRFQGCVMRFTQGLPIGVNSMRWGPDGALYFGGIGATRGWQWRNTTFGLGRLDHNGNNAFEIQTMRAVTDGFIVTMTKPVAPGVLGNTTHYLPVATASYPNPSYNYGAGKVDGPNLTVTLAEELPDGRSVRLTIPGLAPDTTVHLRMTDGVVSGTGEPLWSGEAYYTLNELPNDFESAWAGWVTTHFPGIADLEVIAPGADFDSDGDTNLAEFFSGMNPRAFNARDTIRFSGDSAALTFVSREPASIPSPLEVRWETSANLSSWTDVTAEVVLEGETPADAGFVERGYRLIPEGAPDRLFIRRVLALPQ